MVASSSAAGALARLFRPAARAGLQSAGIMTCADATTQLAVEKRRLFDDGDTQNCNAADCNSERDLLGYDQWRTLRWSLVGLTLHGPYFLHAFARLDRHFGPATSLSGVATKTAVAQFIVFPPYLAACSSTWD